MNISNLVPHHNPLLFPPPLPHTHTHAHAHNPPTFRCVIHSAGHVLCALLQPHGLAATEIGVGACLWDSALVLTAYLGEHAMPHVVITSSAHAMLMSGKRLFETTSTLFVFLCNMHVR